MNKNLFIAEVDRQGSEEMTPLHYAARLVTFGSSTSPNLCLSVRRQFEILPFSRFFKVLKKFPESSMISKGYQKLPNATKVFHG